MKAHENPFRSATVAELRYRMDQDGRDTLVVRLRDLNWRACLLGPRGTGKTTLLEDLADSVETAGRRIHWFRLNLESTRDERKRAAQEIASLEPGTVALVDGGEVFGRLQWVRLMRAVRYSEAGIVATVHRPCGLPVLHHTGTNVEDALHFTRELAGPDWSAELEAVARRAFDESKGNVREVFRAAYWHCAKG